MDKYREEIYTHSLYVNKHSKVDLSRNEIIYIFSYSLLLVALIIIYADLLATNNWFFFLIHWSIIFIISIFERMEREVLNENMLEWSSSFVINLNFSFWFLLLSKKKRLFMRDFGFGGSFVVLI